LLLALVFIETGAAVWKSVRLCKINRQARE
jgi:hypothetical protein